MFYFRINKLKILDNKESGFLFFKRDLAQVKILSFVTTTDSNLPDLDRWMKSTDPAQKKIVLGQAITAALNARILTEIDNVKDNQTLRFGDTGYVLFQSKTIPEDFNWCFIAIEGDDNVRAIEQSLNSVIKRADFDTFAANLATLAASAANPVFAVGVAVAKFLTSVAADIIKQNQDDQIGILYMSLNRQEHYLHGERKKDDVPDLTGNMWIDYSIFAFDES